MPDRNKTNFSWNLRKYREGDELSIVDLLDIAFGKWKGITLTKIQTIAYWKWWYKQNPAGSPIIWLAEHDNKIIGHYGIVPMKMKVGNTYLTGSVGCDAATHPQYQGKGIFSYIINKCYQDAAENNIPLTYGFANIHLGPTYKRYEWRGHISFITNMIKVLNWEPVLSRYIHYKFLARFAAYFLGKIYRSNSELNSDLEIKRIRYFDERINIFWEDISNHFKIIVKRDQTFLNWRYVDHPLNKYTIFIAVRNDRIFGYCVLREERKENLRRGQIVDILGLQNHYNVIGYLIQRAFKYFKEKGIDYISCHMSEKNPYIKFFKKAGFTPYPRHKTALVASINLQGSIIDEKAVYDQALIFSQNSFLKEKKNWFIMSGDGDLG